ncbi:MAG: hypothetical protein WC655_05740 [Candidatus Hydrogenedentales bacterium]|jgi:hypothetical protein
MNKPHLSHISKAIVALESGSLSNDGALQSAAKSLAYACLRVVILGSEGADILNSCSSRLVAERLHMSRQRVRQRLQSHYREVLAALEDYPENAL